MTEAANTDQELVGEQGRFKKESERRGDGSSPLRTVSDQEQPGTRRPRPFLESAPLGEPFFLKPRRGCIMFGFARAHGLWTYEPRQGRKAATVVCSTDAVVTLAFLRFGK